MPAENDDVEAITNWLIKKIEDDKEIPKASKKIAKRAVLVGRNLVLAIFDMADAARKGK